MLSEAFKLRECECESESESESESENQGDQIGRFFAFWAIFYLGQFF
jgi:hypothetical protein